MESTSSHTRRAGHGRRGAFTLIEVLVVVGIIALLIAILMPALSDARREARRVACATNLHHVGQAVALYTSRYRVYPASYLYAYDQRGRYSLDRQTQGERQFYLHWSYFLYSDGKVDDKAFQCGEFAINGHPRTNPGPEQSDWEGYADDQGNTAPNATMDRQAARMCYTANAALMPRNKFTMQSSGNAKRVNQFVNESAVTRTGSTILVAEFVNSTKAITSREDSNGLVVKSHRSITPFYNLSSGWDEYADSGRAPFQYGPDNGSDTETPFGLVPMNSTMMSGEELIGKNAPKGQKANVVGRHHPGGDKDMGGTANFLYADGHVENKTILTTLQKREWGDRYYSLSGTNDVLPARR